MVRFVVGPVYDYTPKSDDEFRLADQYWISFQSEDANDKLLEMQAKQKLTPSGNIQQYASIKVNSEQDAHELISRGILITDLQSGKFNASAAAAAKKRKQEIEDEKVEKTEAWCKQRCQELLTQLKDSEKVKTEEEKVKNQDITNTTTNSIYQCALVANKGGWAWIELSKGVLGRIEHSGSSHPYFRLPTDVESSSNDGLCHFYAGWLSLQHYMIKAVSVFTNEIPRNSNPNQPPRILNFTVELIIRSENLEYTNLPEKLSEFVLSDPGQKRMYSILKQLHYRMLFNHHPLINIKWQIKHKNCYLWTVARCLASHLQWLQKSSGSPLTAKKLKASPPVYWDTRSRQINLQFYQAQKLAKLKDINEIVISIRDLDTRTTTFNTYDSQKDQTRMQKETQMLIQVLVDGEKVPLLAFQTTYYVRPYSVSLYYLVVILRWLKTKSSDTCKLKIKNSQNVLLKQNLKAITDSKNYEIYSILFNNSTGDKSQLLDAIQIQQALVGYHDVSLL